MDLSPRRLGGWPQAADFGLGRRRGDFHGRDRTMTKTLLAAAIGATAFAAPAFAHDDPALETCVARVEQQLEQRSAPSAREIQSSVDAYLATARPDATLVGGPGSAGYDGGFWIRGGSFLMKINLTIQTRWEAFDWNDESAEPRPGGDLSGFSLPRVTLKFSGDASCDIHYYAELEFGHSGTIFGIDQNRASLTDEIIVSHEVNSDSLNTAGG